MDKIKVIIYGCGVMGCRIAQVLHGKRSFEVAGAVDIAPELAGKDLGESFDPPQTLGVVVEKDADKLFSRAEAQAVVLTTTSHLKDVFSQITQCLEAGLNVISTCEELSYPWRRSPELARELDSLAKEKNATVIGTGINPGYLMDTLPLILTAPCLEVKSVKVTRMMNSAKRRLPFQVKVGTGLTQEEFREKIKNKVITGHVGLLESIYMIADGLGWELSEAVELPPEPVIDERERSTGLGMVKPGDVLGITSVAYGRKEEKDVITLEFCANAAVDEEYDEIMIEGRPDIHQRIISGVHGDVGTVAVTVNTIPRAVEATAGLKVMKDLPPPKATL
jgi:4-hydroxy-tetrahydrodipicolinate reductase